MDDIAAVKDSWIANEYLLRKVPRRPSHSERSEESDGKEILRFAQDDGIDFPQQLLLMFAWRMVRLFNLFGPFAGRPLVGLGSFAVQGSIDTSALDADHFSMSR